VETPFIELGQVSTALYFSYFVLIVPALSVIENTLTDLSSPNLVEKGVFKD
jgi:ubiquinol-cytochrome c reductase cytochrome b subunit